MRVKLKVSLPGEGESFGPHYGTLGEAVYFRYDEQGNLMLHVLFYGWPGIWPVSPKDVDPVH